MVRIISGIFKGRQIQTNQHKFLRPTQDRVKEIMFAKLPDLEGQQILDLFAGSGNLGFEALSRGAQFCTMVERSARQVQLIRQNAQRLNVLAQVDIQRSDVLKFLQPELRIDLVLADPPYQYSHITLLCERLAKLPENTLIVLETEESFQTPDFFRDRLLEEKIVGDTKLNFYRN